MKQCTVKVGMSVAYRSCFGSGSQSTAKIESIELCETEHEKDGIPVDSVDSDDLYRCCIGLDNDSWCYGSQIDRIID